MSDAHSRFEADGYIVLAPVVAGPVCDALLRASQASLRERRAGSRRLLEVPEVSDLARRLRDVPSLDGLLPSSAIAVQCTLFSKQAGTNWSVAPHQDLSIPVASRVDAEGWTGWSRKQGAWFAQPPVDVLDAMIAVRLQLDPADVGGGPLRVVPGSHRSGRLDPAAFARMESERMRPCLVERGGALVMKPLLVHASGRATAATARRVLHFLYGPAQLPDGVRWANALH